MQLGPKGLLVKPDLSVLKVQLVLLARRVQWVLPARRDPLARPALPVLQAVYWAMRISMP